MRLFEQVISGYLYFIIIVNTVHDISYDRNIKVQSYIWYVVKYNQTTNYCVNIYVYKYI